MEEAVRIGFGLQLFLEACDHLVKVLLIASEYIGVFFLCLIDIYNIFFL